MREALAGLTVRGRAFVAAGVTAIVGAVLLGQPTLTRVGVLVLALPLVTALVIARSRYRLALVRTVSPSLVAAGQSARVTLDLSNEGRTPSGVLLLEDRVPYALGTRPRFVVEGVRLGWHRQVSYHVRSDLRGRHEVGPMQVRVTDPFGLVELGRAFQTTSLLTVTPPTVPLPPIRISGPSQGSGEQRPRAFATGSVEDLTVREYRSGDDLRRVHWPSSARVGELMVRREEQPWQSRATVVIDNRASAHRGLGAASSFEAAVRVAASVATHLAHRGYQVRLVTADPGDHALWHDRDVERNTASLLESLALLRTSPATRLDGSWLTEQGHGGVVVAVLGAIGEPDAPVLRQMQSHTAVPLAISLDVDAWVGRSTGSAAPLLASRGWRAVPLGPQDRLDAAWQDLDTRLTLGSAR